MPVQKCFSVSTYKQLEDLINIRNRIENKTIIHIKYYLIKGFGIEWLKTLQLIVSKIDRKHKIIFYVDCGYDYGLSILLIKEKIKYIRLKANTKILRKINNICHRNKVLLNPDFNIVNHSNKYF